MEWQPVMRSGSSIFLLLLWKLTTKSCQLSLLWDSEKLLTLVSDLQGKLTSLNFWLLSFGLQRRSYNSLFSAWKDAAAQWANYWWSGISTKGNEFAQQAAAGFKTVDEYSQNNLCCTFFQVFVSLSIDHDGQEERTAFLCRAYIVQLALSGWHHWVCHTEPIWINERPSLERHHFSPL